MMDLSKSFLTPFDPDKIEGNEVVSGFLYADFAGLGQRWWLVEINPPTFHISEPYISEARTQSGKIESFKYVDRHASAWRDCPWLPLQWPDPEIPDQYLPGYRLTLDCPGGERITRECGPEPEGLKKIASWLLVHAAKMEWRI